MSKLDPDFRAALDELYGVSPRASAIVAAVQVEDALASAIASRLRPLTPAEKKTVFEGAVAPLNTFSQKILIGSALNLYGDGPKADLTLIKDIRNKFAHNLQIRDFDHAEVAPLCWKLSHPHDWNSLAGALGPPTEPWSKFRTVASALHSRLTAATESLPKSRPAFDAARYPLVLDYPKLSEPPPSPGKARAKRTRRNDGRGRSRPKKDDPPQP